MMQAHEGRQGEAVDWAADISGGRPRRLGDIGTGLRRPTEERGLHGGPPTKSRTSNSWMGSGSAAKGAAVAILIY